MTHWLDHSLVLASDYRIPTPERVWPFLERRQDALADLGAHHVLVYTSTNEPERVLVMIALHTAETVIDLLRSRVFFDWFDAAGVDDIPAVFAGELIERLDLAEDGETSAPEVVVSVVTPVENVTGLITHLRDTAVRLRAAGIRRILLFAAFDDPGEVMMLIHIDDEHRARHWLRDSGLTADWLGNAGIGAYPPVFIGTLRRVLRVEGTGRAGEH